MARNPDTPEDRSSKNLPIHDNMDMKLHKKARDTHPYTTTSIYL